MSKIMHVVELPKGEMLTKELLVEAMNYLPPCVPEDKPMADLLNGEGERTNLYRWNYLIERNGVLYREDKLSTQYGPKLIVKVIEAI